MKKNYMSPQTEKVKMVFAHHMLAGSPDAALNTKDELDPTDIASRRESFFDDEE